MKTITSQTKNVFLITSLCLATIQLQSQTNAPNASKAAVAKAGAAGLAASTQNSAKPGEPYSGGWPLPNYQTSTGRGRPYYINFYRMDGRFPAYLLCEYTVKETNYRAADEAKWFNAALDQIRRTGSQKFPPIQWVAVAIHNVADQKGANPFEASYRVGAIFKAGDVFDTSRSLSGLVAQATMDRHPFKYDPQALTPEGRESWVIVEQHAANHPVTALK